MKIALKILKNNGFFKKNIYIYINFRKFIAKIKIQEKKKQQKYVLGENKTLRESYRLALVLQNSNARQKWLVLNYIPDNSVIVAGFSSPHL